ncbi:hypothetical protein V5O48_018425 [Marasmius crinis-equi]|uniref:U1-type domain-containing protein n=1 Tax=Marasmius crinis-equi TaxID=585013 RepID=A0ABR3EL76_9AGAR
MDIKSKEQHKQGKAHRSKSAAKAVDPTPPLPLPSPSPSPSPAYLPPSGRRLPMTLREVHSQSKAHEDSTVTEKIARQSVQTASADRFTQRRSWTCTVCYVDMDISERDRHLSTGFLHVAALRGDLPDFDDVGGGDTGVGVGVGQPTPPSVPVTPLVQVPPSTSLPALQPDRIKHWICKPCNRRMMENSRESHLRGKAHREVEEKARQSGETSRPKQAASTGQSTTQPESRFWACTVCGIDMNVSHRERHLAGEMHLAKLQRRPPHCNLEGIDGSYAGGRGGGGAGRGEGISGSSLWGNQSQAAVVNQRPALMLMHQAQLIQQANALSRAQNFNYVQVAYQVQLAMNVIASQQQQLAARFHPARTSSRHT